MPNPFPGMDPYLEMQPFWSDFAPTLLGEIRNALLPKLLPNYDVRIEEYLVVMHEDIKLHRVKPDVTVAATTQWQPTSSATTAAPDTTTIELDYPDIEPQKQRRLKIIHQPDQQPVTVVELLSPSNKENGEDGIEAYLEKRTELIASHVNLVEIDLLRGGERLPMREPLPAADYFVYVGRPNRRPRCQLVYWPLSKPLPKIQIPLLPEDGDAELDLGEVFRSAYEPALYDRRLPYDQPLKPKPSESDQKWILDCLSKRES